MTGMFQSSRIASGRPRLHTSSAFSPSSASMTWKSRLSRICRAIFRTTLESSTTRHVLIEWSPCLLRFASRLGGDRGFGCDFEHAIDVEDDHELSVEAMDAAGELGHAGVEIDGVFLAAVVGQPQHFADLVDQEAVGFPAQVDADRHRRLAVTGLGQAET